MKKILFIITLINLGCKPNPIEYAKHINGYWEIENVYKNGKLLKEFKISQRIDFFKINEDLSGYRKKLKTNLDGTYTSSNDKLSFNLEIKLYKRLILVYVDNNTTFNEEVIKVNNKNLSIKNDNGLIYNYKAYKPLEIN